MIFWCNNSVIILFLKMYYQEYSKMNYIIGYIQSCNEHNALRVAKYTINPRKNEKKKMNAKSALRIWM